ncbi:hypothetical protein STEG23_010814, partial [Scotinomys teguina]
YTYSRTHFPEHKLHVLWSEKNLKPHTLPPLQQATGHSETKMKTLRRIQSGVQSQTTVEMTDLSKNVRGSRRKEGLHHGKMQAKVRLMRLMLRNQRASLQELYKHEDYLSKLNQELIQSIRDMEEGTAMNVRTMLQEQDVFGNVISILEYSNKNRVQQLRSELQEWKEKEESKTNSLKQEVEKLNAEVVKAHEEVNFLSTYMDHEYPVRSVQIANHIRQVQQAKDSQQEELDSLKEMREMVLGRFSNLIQEKKKKILRSLMVKTQKPFEEVLLLKIRDSQYLQKCMVGFRQFIEQMKEEIPVIIAEVEQMYAGVWDPREVVFKDILLKRPKPEEDIGSSEVKNSPKDVFAHKQQEEILRTRRPHYQRGGYGSYTVHLAK